MRDMGIVQGSAERAIPLIVCVDTVYVKTDIQRVDTNDEHVELYEWHEIQYDKDEYIQLMAQQKMELENLVNVMLGVE